MARVKFPHLHTQLTQHKKRVWYVRIGHGPRVRVSEPAQTAKFRAAYLAALRRAEKPAEAPRAGQKDTLAWLVEEHKRSSYWLGLKPATRRQRENIFKHVVAGSGKADYHKVNEADVIGGRERRAATPSAANNYLDVMRSLFGWAVDVKLLTKNPAKDVKGVSRPDGEGFVPWTDEHLRRFEERWPLGTRQRLALGLLRYTGLRRGDVVRLGPQHLVGGYFRLATEKTSTWVSIPVSAELTELIAASPAGSETYLVTERGVPFAKESYGNWFKKACVAAGVPGASHGLRKYAATHLTHLGVTDAQLEAIMGWVPGSGMTGIYTRQRDVDRLSREAAKLVSLTPGPVREPGG